MEHEAQVGCLELTDRTPLVYILSFLSSESHSMIVFQYVRVIFYTDINSLAGMQWLLARRTCPPSSSTYA